MGLFDSGVRKGRERQKNGVLAEAQKSGSQVVDVLELSDEVEASQVLGGSLKMLFGGDLSSDGVQIFHLQRGGWSHVYVQPYDGMYPLPGEHHAVLTGSLPAPAVLEAPGGLFRGGARWESPAEPRLAESLNTNAALQAQVKGLPWEWGMGTGVIKLKWALQFRSLGDGATHLVMRAGRFGGVTTYGVGVAMFVALSGTLHAWMQSALNAPQQPLEPITYGQVLPLLYGLPLAAATPQVEGGVQAQNSATPQGDDAHAKINAAARLMTSRQFDPCIHAYQQIATQHPEHAATCHAQIGAALFFLAQYELAISHYEWAKQNGADPRMMDENIAEAQQALHTRPG